jgi:competence protein ComEC
LFLFFTGAVLLGVALGSYLVYLPLLVLFCLILAAAILTIGERRGRLAVGEGAVLYGALLGGVLLWTLSARDGPGPPLASLEGQGPVSVRGTVVEPPAHAPNRVVLILAVSRVGEGAAGRSLSGRLRVTWREPDRTFLPGDEVGFTARIHPPSGTRNPGGFDYGAYLVHQGIDAVASVSGPGRVSVTAVPPRFSRWTPWRIIEQWRGRIRQAALATLPDPARGVYLGIIIGEQGYLEGGVRDAFMATGTVHILSISGSHLGLVAVLSFVLIKSLCRVLPAMWLLVVSRSITPTRLAAAATMVLVTFYTLLAGAEVATVRSLVMIAIVMLAVWLGRTHDLLRAVACAALLLVVQNPRALYDISFQLSFLAVVAIAVVIGARMGDEADGLPPQGRAVRRAISTWVRDYLWLTGSVTLATLPLVAYYFKQIAWLGVVANAFVVPLAGCVLVPLGLGSAIWLLLTGQDVLPAASWNQASSELMTHLVARLATVPGAEWHVASPPAVSLAAFYLLLVAAIWTVPEGRPRWRRWGCLVGAVLLLGWWGWSPRASPDGDAVRVTFLDVGQGDACLLELPDGQTVLIDAGAQYDTLDMGRAVVGPYLWERGITRLDHVIATHPQLDHVGGLAWVVRSFQVGRYWSNGVAREESFYQRLQETLRARGLVEERAEEGRAIVEAGPCRLDVLNPPAGTGLPREGGTGGPSSGSVLNNLSIVTRLQCGAQTFLLTADAEAGALARLHHRGLLAGATILKVPHHGAASSLYGPWIEQAGAKTAVVSVGRHNSYGHPAPGVVAAYRSAGIHVLRTDRDGAVWITARLSRPELRIDTARDGMLTAIPFTSIVGTAELTNWRRLLQKGRSA